MQTLLITDCAHEGTPMHHQQACPACLAWAPRRLRDRKVGAVQDPWGRLVWLWDRPPLKRVRLTISMAQWSVRLPALLALIATQAQPRSTLPFNSLLLLLRVLSHADVGIHTAACRPGAA